MACRSGPEVLMVKLASKSARARFCRQLPRICFAISQVASLYFCMRRFTPAVLLLLFACSPSIPESVEVQLASLTEDVDYNRDIKPILSDRCYLCHGPDISTRKADLRLDIEEGAREVIGSKDIIRRLVSTDPQFHMPPPESNVTVTDEEKALIIKWIDQGAPFQKHWSFIPASMPELPTVQQEDWPITDIDQFILAKIEKTGLTPADRATKETLLRRASFDLTGLPPTKEDIESFLNDNSQDAYENLVDNLLATVHFGERMATEWLDVARYADSHGYQDDGMRNMWPYRDWVIKAFNQNMPFDQFTTWQLAGDLLENPTDEQLLATAFNRNHLQTQEGGVIEEEYRTEYVADRTDVVTRAYLGMSARCARCHDHKFDPISQKEYFQMFSFFNNNNERGQIPYSGEAAPTLIMLDDEDKERRNSLEDEIAELEEVLDYKHESYDSGFQTWKSSRDESQVVASMPIAHYPFDRLDEKQDKDKTKYYFASNTAKVADAVLAGDQDQLPTQVEGKVETALTLVGDSWVDTIKEVKHFERNEPFSSGIWIKVLTDSVEGPMIAQSAGLMNGDRGILTKLMLDGRIEISLNHVAPDNSIIRVSKNPIEVGKWEHLTITYDGSSKASGFNIYRDGRHFDSEILVDNLNKSIITDSVGGNWNGYTHMKFGKLAESSLDSVVIDDWKIFDYELTPLEVLSESGQTDDQSSDDDLRRYYVQRINPEYKKQLEKATKQRGELNDFMTAQPEVMIMQERSFKRPTYILDRGAYDAPTEEVSEGVIEAILAFDESLPRNRLGLAKWILDPQNPLTARVTVNRFWQYIFGTALVSTPDDFGNQGAFPSHPLLLDYLATDFVESGWDVKALIKKMVMSSTYMQSSIGSDLALEKDPSNTLYSRGSSYRLPAEMVRDNALAASGLMVREVGGPSVYPYQPAGLWKELATRNATVYNQDSGDNLYRRSMYTIWKRTTPPPTMTNFDAPERNFCVVKRQNTNTPLQALVLMNDPQFVEAARILAERMLKEGGNSVVDRISLGFLLLTSRKPNDSELAGLLDLYESELELYKKDQASAIQLLSIGDFPRDKRLDPAETAAYTVVANTIMNFDEAIYKR